MSGNKLPEPSPRTTKLSGPTDFKVNIYLHQLSENASHSSKTKTKPQVNKTGHSPAGTRCPAAGNGPRAVSSAGAAAGQEAAAVRRAPGSGAHSSPAPALPWCPRPNPRWDVHEATTRTL